MKFFWLVVAFIYGTVLGSFLNVCIYRLPRDESIIFPPSRCPFCKIPLKFWQNIPILSFLVLRGKCSYCRAAISFRYFFVEFASGTFLASVFYMYGFSIFFWHAIVLFGLLIVIFYIDLDHQLILDVVIYPGILFGLIISFFMPDFFYSFQGPGGSYSNKILLWAVSPLWLKNFLDVLIGGIFGFFLFILIRGIASFLAKTEAMGLGDVKMAALIGVYLGFAKAALAFIFSFFCGAMVALPLLVFKIKEKKDPIPFGTFMALGAIFSLFWGNILIDWYISFQYIF